MTDGALGYGGYFRILGIESAAATLLSWNDDSVWKFAWPDWIRQFFCFGETAWGDQYAYRIQDLTSKVEPPVYFLESLSLSPELIAPSFADFLKNEFAENCNNPYDDVLVSVRRRLGDIMASEHIVYAPSPLLTGIESADCVIKMPAISAMILNGDLHCQLENVLEDRVVDAIEPYVDRLGRPRIKVLWSR